MFSLSFGPFLSLFIATKEKEKDILEKSFYFKIIFLLFDKSDQQYIKNTLQSTLNLLHYAAKADEDLKTKEGTLFLGFGINDIYANLYHKMEYDFEEIKTLYKEKKYDDVIERVEKMLKYLDNFYLVYVN